MPRPENAAIGRGDPDIEPLIPKKLALILGYMAFIFVVFILMIHYAREHPIEDVRPEEIKASKTAAP